MRRALFTLGIAAGLAAPAAAQWVGVPVWNSPTGGGVVISADYAKPNGNYGNGSTWGARISWGRGTLTITAGAASWNPEGAGETLVSFGGNAAFRLIGDTLPTIASRGIRANLQIGAAHTDTPNLVVSATSETTLTGAVGLGAQLPAQGFSVEPYFSPGIRYRSLSDGTSRTEFGFAIGANVSFGLLGVHLAYDSENLPGGGKAGVLGVGAQLTP